MNVPNDNIPESRDIVSNPITQGFQDGQSSQPQPNTCHYNPYSDPYENL